MQDAEATVAFGFRATKVDSCGPEQNITAWREALDDAAAAAGVPRIELENCRNYAFTQNLTGESDCPFDLLRSTEAANARERAREHVCDFWTPATESALLEFMPLSLPMLP